MLGFIKMCFFTRLVFLSTLTSINLLSCISMNNQECKIWPQIVNINSDEPVFFPFSVKTSKCSGSCHNINDPYAKMCVPDVVKNLNVKMFNLMSRTNERRHAEWHDTCKCKCRLDASICNNKQRWNDDKCRCECKELIDKDVCDNGTIWNPGNCEWKCKQSCDVGEYLVYENCKCRKKLVDKLIEECTEKYWSSKNSWNNVIWAWKWGCMFLHNLCCFVCNSLNNHHWIISFVLVATYKKDVTRVDFVAGTHATI